jgi:hypothetical protein
MSTTPLVQRGGAIRIYIHADSLLAGAQRIAGDGETAEANL